MIARDDHRAGRAEHARRGVVVTGLTEIVLERLDALLAELNAATTEAAATTCVEAYLAALGEAVQLVTGSGVVVAPAGAGEQREAAS